MRAALVIARKELGERLRDRTFFIVGIIAPLGLAFIFNLVIGGAFSGESNPVFEFGIADSDEGPISDGFSAMLVGMEDSGLVVLTSYATPEEAEVAVENGDLDAAFILPPELSTAVLLNRAPTIAVVENVDSAIGGQLATALAQRFAERAAIIANGTRAAIAAGALDPATAAAGVAADAAATTAPMVLQEVQVRSRTLGTSTFFAAGLAIFFIIFIAGMATTSLLEERTNGTLSRLLAAPIRPSSIIAGKTVANILLGIIAMVILAVASTLLMKADWGNPVLAFIVIVAAVFSVAGVMTFVGGLARTAEQAQSMQSVVATTLAMLGGSFFPLTDSAGFVATLRYITPNAWYLKALGDVSVGATADVLVSVGVMVAIGVVFGGVGLTLARRALRP